MKKKRDSMTKTGFIWCVKAIAAGITAFCILALFCVFYYNPPIHVVSGDKATCYKREPGSFWARATEGMAWGKIDQNGYNNSESVWETGEVDLLMMGSSQTEGLYVRADQCASSLLNGMFSEDGRGYQVYNIGMSAHTVYQNANNLQQAMEVYQPKRYVAIETGSVSYDILQYLAIEDGSFENLTLQEYPPVIAFAEKIPYVKLLYQQWKNYRNKEGGSEALSPGEDVYDSAGAAGRTGKLLDYMNDRVTAEGCTLILYYIPEVAFDEQGNMYFASDANTRESYGQMCREKGILFVDMADVLQRAYDEDHEVGAGFANTTVGYGHLNAKGHRMLANAIYEVIAETEEQK
ncbi:MAG: hypothetical protein IJ567_08610 [Lachnospiraceae bacterium]|nr:hypothetical protein [Lachnospiraceae bacterium]